MKDFIHLIWSGDYSPAHDFDEEHQEIKEMKCFKKINQEKLLSLLSEEAHAAFLRYEECQNDLTWLYLERAFTEGARFAARFLVEALG